MMRFLRKGDYYALEKSIKKNYYLPLYSFKCLLLSVSAYCYQFSCNVQESRASGTTGYVARLMAALAHAIQVLRTFYTHKRSIVDTCLTHERHNNHTCLTHERHMNDTTNCVKEVGIGNEQAGVKQAWSMTSVLRFNRLLIHCYYFTHTWLILRPYSKNASTRVAGWFGIASRLGRTLVHTCSTVVRQLFECCSSATRTTLEAHPKSTRSRVEQVSNTTRSRVEGQSKRTRRIVEQVPNNSRSRVEGLANRLPHFVCNDGKVLNELYMSRLISKWFYSLSEKVSGEVGSMFVENKRSSQNGLNVVVDFSIFGTSGYSDMGGALAIKERLRQDVRSDGSKGTDGVGIKRGYSRDIVLFVQQLRRMLGFQKEYFRSAMESLCHYVSNISKISRLGLLTIFCVLFSFASLVEAQAQEPRQVGATGFDVVSDTVIRGHRIVPYTTTTLMSKVKKSGKYALELYPWESYEIDTSLITKINVGDSIPSSLLNLPLTIVGRNVPIDTITLNDLANDKLLVIDFWTTWCAPCIGSMQKWEEIQEQLPDDVVLLGVHLDYAFKARPFIVDRGWNSYSSIGLNAYVLNRHFFHQDVISRVVFIKDGRFLTVGGTSGYDLSAVKQFLAGDVSSIPARLEWTYAVERSLQ